MQLVFEASDSVDWAQTMGNSTMVPAPVLRSVILYCFALNICASEEIIEASETEAGVNYLRANFEFEWSTIHEFRRHGYSAIRDALTNLFVTIFLDAGQTPSVFAARCEAEARLRRAIQADSIVLDL